MVKKSSQHALPNYIALMEEIENAVTRTDLHNASLKIQLFIQDKKNYRAEDWIHYGIMCDMLRASWAIEFAAWEAHLALMAELNLITCLN